MWGHPEIVSETTNPPTEVAFFLPNEPIKSFPDTVEHQGKGQYSLATELPAQVLLFFDTAQKVDGVYNLRDAEFVAGLQYDGIFRLGSVWDSGRRMELVADGVRKETISAHPPPNGQTVLQFLLSLPHAQELTFSFSMGLPDNCSLNGQNRFEHFTFNTPVCTGANKMP